MITRTTLCIIMLSMYIALPLGAAEPAGTTATANNNAIADLAWQAGDAISAEYFAAPASCTAFAAGVYRKAALKDIQPAFAGCFAQKTPLPGEAWLALLTLTAKDVAAMVNNNPVLKTAADTAAALPANPKAVDLRALCADGDGSTALRAALVPNAGPKEFSDALRRLILTRQKQHNSLRILATGFEPFGGFPTNPSWDGLRRIDALAWARRDVFLLRFELPVAYGGAETRLRELAQRYQPDMILSTGLAAGSPFIRIETRAFNGAISAKDNNGKTLSGKIKGKGALYLPTAFDAAAMAKDLTARGFEAHTSDDAGGYLCNYVYYIGGDWCAAHGCKNLFVHVPRAEPPWSLDRIAEALDMVLDRMVAARCAKKKATQP